MSEEKYRPKKSTITVESDGCPAKTFDAMELLDALEKVSASGVEGFELVKKFRDEAMGMPTLSVSEVFDFLEYLKGYGERIEKKLLGTQTSPPSTAPESVQAAASIPVTGNSDSGSTVTAS